MAERPSGTSVELTTARAGPARAVAVVPDRQLVHDRWATALFVAVWAWVVVPRLVQSVTAPKFRASVGVEAAAYSAPAALALTALTLGVLGLCALIVLDTVRDPHPGLLGPLVVALAPWLYLVVRDLLAGSNPQPRTLVYPAIVVAIWLLRPRVQTLGRLGCLVALAALLSIALAVVLPDKGIFRTSLGAEVAEDKEILPWGMLVGFLTHGNNLGQFLALGLPLVAMVPRRGLRWPLLAVTTFALVWTASRSSLAALGVTLLAALVIGVTPRASRAAMGVVVALAPWLAVCALPLVTDNPEAFTNRGLVWAVSLDWWAQSPYVGHGSGWYAAVGSTSGRVASTVFHGHNQLVQLLVTGGLVLAVLVLVPLVAAAVRAARMASQGWSSGVVWLATLAGTCVLEKSFSLVDNASMMPVFALPLAVLLFGHHDPEPAV